MSSLKINSNIHYIKGESGPEGARIGGTLIIDNPLIVIGLAGKSFASNLKEFLNQQGLSKHELILLLPYFSIYELTSMKEFVRKFPKSKIYVNKILASSLVYPDRYYFVNRFKSANQEFFKNSLKYKIRNFVEVTHSAQLQTENSKIRFIDAFGPHAGHMFIHVVPQKILITGLFGKLFQDLPLFYYCDLTGSRQELLKEERFVKMAQFDWLITAFDSPSPATKRLRSSIDIKTQITELDKIILTCISDQIQTFQAIYDSFHSKVYIPKIETLATVSFFKTLLSLHLNYLVEKGFIQQIDEKFKL